MHSVHEVYSLWSRHPYFDSSTRQELLALAGAESEIEDRFYTSLEFGTGGLRGLIGAGTNRMNIYTVRRATQGLADYVTSFGEEAKRRGVVIAHDSRRFSREFTLEAALILAANGITAFIWESLRPTPLLSFAVREMKAQAGIVITASHNPPQYNGYKVYWEDGGQVPPERASAIQDAINAVSDITMVQPLERDVARNDGLLRPVPSSVDRAYLDRLATLVSTRPEQRRDCRILYSPLHGTGNIPVRQTLSEAGYQVSVVPEQELPDPNFSTVKYPNPEEKEVFVLALKQAEAEQPDVIMATDPDADRLGVLARDRDGAYQLLTGNQIGAILVDYILASRTANGTLPTNGAVIKTIATSNMIAPLCQPYGVALMDTHTGFKFIGDKIREFEETGSYTFLLGYEESYGYLGAPFVRDKDAVMAALLVAEATAFHKAHGRTLYDALRLIWQKCGHFLEDLHNITLPGKEGQAQIADLMNSLRKSPPQQIGGIPVVAAEDHQTDPLGLGKANVLHYRFADGGFVMVRPSGTEPKLKLYFSVAGSSEGETAQRLQAVKADALRIMGLAEKG